MDTVEILKRYRESSSVEEQTELASKIFSGPLAFLKGYIFVICKKDHDLTAEVFGLTCESIVKDLGKANGESEAKFIAWSKTIAKRRHADIFRDPNNTRVEYFPTEDLEEAIEASTAEIPMTSDEKEERDFAFRLLEQAGPNCREIMRLRIFEGMEPEEIAHHIAATSGTEYTNISAKIKHCLKCARAFARKRGLTYAEHR